MATPGVPDDQVPPLVISLSVSVEPGHTGLYPVIAAGKGFTVIKEVALQPVPVL